MIEQEFANIYPLTSQNVLAYLPHLDCGECGYSSCEDFAEALISTKPLSKQCPELHGQVASVLDRMLEFVPEPIPFNVMMETISPGLVEIGEPSASSPALVTGNFQETVRLLENVLNSCGTTAFLLVSDTKGYSVDNAVEEKRFTPFEVLKVITQTEIGSMVNHRNLIIPGLAKSLAGQIHQSTGWQITIGPISGLELPLFLMRELLDS